MGSVSKKLPRGCGSFVERKGGLLGHYLRALSVGMWDQRSAYGAEVVAVTAPAAHINSEQTVAHLQVTTQIGDKDPATSYVRILANDTDGSVLSIDDLGSDGQPFMEALLAQSNKWDPWISKGSVLS